MTTKFGWCLDNRHEWCPVHVLGNVIDGKLAVSRCSCSCHDEEEE